MITSSKPTAAAWSIAGRTDASSAWRTWKISGFSSTHGATVRYMRRRASPRRSRSLADSTSSNTRNDCQLAPGPIATPGPSGGAQRSRHGVRRS